MVEGYKEEPKYPLKVEEYIGQICIECDEMYFPQTYGREVQNIQQNQQKYCDQMSKCPTGFCCLQFAGFQDMGDQYFMSTVNLGVIVRICNMLENVIELIADKYMPPEKLREYQERIEAAKENKIEKSDRLAKEKRKKEFAEAVAAARARNQKAGTVYTKEGTKTGGGGDNTLLYAGAAVVGAGIITALLLRKRQ